MSQIGAAAGRKSVFITGAASGIGRAAAVRFAREGWFVGLADVDAAGLRSALEAIGPQNGLGIPLDVRYHAAWNRGLKAFADQTGGRLDVLVNNAGVARYGWLEDQGPEDLDVQVDVNLKGVIIGAQAALPYLRVTPGSRLINISSCAGLAGAPQMAIYAATKFAVRGLSEALAAEFARFGVGVSCVMPWFVETPILDSGGHSSNRTIRDAIREGKHPVYPAEDAAEAIWAATRSDKLEHFVGARARQLATMARFAPGLVRNQIRRGL